MAAMFHVVTASLRPDDIIAFIALFPSIALGPKNVLAPPEIKKRQRKFQLVVGVYSTKLDWKESNKFKAKLIERNMHH